MTSVKDERRWSQQHEEMHAQESCSFNSDIKAEMDKVEWCDLLILQFPVHWFGLPAMLKSWVDKVFAFGFAYASQKWYNRGIFKAKKAMLSLTTGAPDFLYKHDSVQGSIEDILFPINHGILYFCGFQVVQPFITFTPSASADLRTSELARLGKYIEEFDKADTIRYPTLEDTSVPSAAASQIPKETVDMISTCNSMMRGWADNDAAIFSSHIGSTYKMELPGGISAEGFDAAWAIRASLGAEPLHPHVCSSHSFSNPHQIKCYCEVTSKTTGKLLQLSECSFTFDPKNHSKVILYQQENIFVEK